MKTWRKEGHLRWLDTEFPFLCFACKRVALKFGYCHEMIFRDVKQSQMIMILTKVMIMITVDYGDDG